MLETGYFNGKASGGLTNTGLLMEVLVSASFARISRLPRFSNTKGGDFLSTALVVERRRPAIESFCRRHFDGAPRMAFARGLVSFSEAQGTGFLQTTL